MNSKPMKNFICLLLAIVLLFSDVCFGAVKTYSLLSYNSHENTASTIDLQNGVTSSPVICTGEMLGQRDTLRALKQNPRTYDLKGLKIDVCPFFGNNFPENFSFFYMTASGQSGCIIRTDAVIVTYIHNQDGKKA